MIRVCDLFDKPLVLSFWFTEGADCLPTQDLSTSSRRRYAGRVNFLSVNVRDEREDVAGIVRERGWRVPVGWDADGAVSNLYRVGGCPTVAYAYPGGLMSEAAIGGDALTEERMTADVDGCCASPSAARAWTGERLRRAGDGARLARPRSCARSSPGLALHQLTVERGSGRSTRATQGAPAGALRPVRRRARRSTSATSRSRGRIGSSSATSGSTPTTSGPRSRSSPWSG